MTKHTWEPPEKKHAAHEDAPETQEDAPEIGHPTVKDLVKDLIEERIEERRPPTGIVLSAPHQT